MKSVLAGPAARIEHRSGDFAVPMFVHDTTPPGVPVMKQLKDKIGYKLKSLDCATAALAH